MTSPRPAPSPLIDRWTPGQCAIHRIAIAIGLALVPPAGESWVQVLYWTALLLVPFRRLAIPTLFVIYLGTRALELAGWETRNTLSDVLYFVALFSPLQAAGTAHHSDLARLPSPAALFVFLAWANALDEGWWMTGALISVPFVMLAGWVLPKSRLPFWLLGLALGGALILAGHPPMREIWILHAFALMPWWLPRRAAALPLTVFYDGACGFCQRGVRFLLGEDPEGAALRFAPLQGTSFAAAVPAAGRAALPDSLVVRDAAGALAVRSDAVLRIGAALGGYWRPLAALGRLVPRSWRDAAYDAIARRRARWAAAQPDGLCPLPAAEQGARFDP